MPRCWIGPLLLLLACAGCGPSAAPPRPTGADAAPPVADTTAAPTPAAPDTAATVGPGPAPAEPFAGTVGDTERPASPGAEVAQVGALRVGRHQGFDRIVIAFDTPALPAYEIAYVDRPVRDCGSGEEVPVAGDAWLEIRLEPARGHDEAGRSTVEDRNRQVALPSLRHLVVTCDFEAQFTVVAGVAWPGRYRVTEQRAPARLVVDVAHR